ncbi:MAG: winged helix-turn-helix domain-containing protein, partial [Magnetococcus sp. DMHC-1]
MEESWKEAIKKVLSESGEPLHYADISAQILSLGYYKTDGATPSATVSAQITSAQYGFRGLTEPRVPARSAVASFHAF